MSQQKYDAICISSGGVKGFAALGALQYLQDSQHLDFANIKFMSGTSVGAAICFFLAIGFTPIELMVYMCTHKLLEKLKLRRLDEIFTCDGLYDWTPIHKECETMCISKIHYIPTFKQLYELTGVELVFATYNMTKMQIEYLNYRTYPELSCLDGVRMSCNIPFVFSPFFINGCEYIDGACYDEFPASQIPLEEKRTVGIYLDVKKENSDENTNKLFEISGKIFKILTIPMQELRRHHLEKLDKKIDIITILVDHIPIYRFDLRSDQRLELFSTGYNSARQFCDNSTPPPNPPFTI